MNSSKPAEKQNREDLARLADEIGEKKYRVLHMIIKYFFKNKDKIKIDPINNEILIK